MAAGGRRSRCAAALLLLGVGPQVSAQSLDRFSLDSVVAVDLFRGENAGERPNIIVDVTGVLRLADGWVVYVRPWFRQPRTSEWDKEIYQAAVQYERPGRVSTRVDAGYIVSPIGLGMMDSRPGVNPTISTHLSYVTPMPVFDPTAPRARPLASSYPLGTQVTISGSRWDTRGALITSSPTRQYVINGGDRVRGTPVMVAGGGLTPRPGLRLGLSVARGAHATREELTTPAFGERRNATLLSTEGEFAFGYSKIAGEFTRNRIDSHVGTETAYSWFLQGVHTLTPRIFVAGRQEGASAPPLRTGTVPGRRTMLHISEATVGYRIVPELAARVGYLARKPYTRSAYDHQVGVSLVWSQRWR
jgi:hypothetical protein